MEDRPVRRASDSTPRRSAAPTIVLSSLGVLALAGVLAILLPFIGPILLAGALSITVYPFYRGMGRRWPGLSPSVRALLTDLAILTLFLVPVPLLVWTAASQADSFRPGLSRWIAAGQAIHEGRLDESLRGMQLVPEVMSRWLGVSSAQGTAWLLGYAARGLDRLADWAAQSVAEFLQGAAVSLAVCPLLTFFLLRDGPAYVARLRDILPLEVEDTQCLFDRTRDATVAVVRGLFLTGLLEGAASTLGYTLMGVQAAALLGVLTGAASVVPVVGTSSVWVPVGLATILSGHTIPGVLVIAWGTAMVLGIDNFAAPWLVGHRIRVSLLPLFFGILGGAAVFGVKGLLIGPLIVSIAPTVFELVRRRVLAWTPGLHSEARLERDARPPSAVREV
jgi:predicted PurR-regulated permease PerM